MSLNDRNPDQLRAWRQRGAANWQAKLRRQGGKGRRQLREDDARKAFREALALRSGGMCEVSTPACPPGPHRGHDGHHMSHADKQRGVHLPSRGLWVCRLGHDWIEENKAESYERGWLLRDDGDPIRLHDCGRFHRGSEPCGGAA